MTAIEWTDQTWNPTTGCSKVSPGCANCYAETLSLRFGWSKKPWTPENAAENVVLHPERLETPYRWRKPRRVFVNSMSDLFHEEIPDEFIARVFTTMRGAPMHTFQVLTKRPERALEWFRRCGDAEGMGWITHDATPPGGAYWGTGIVVGDHDRWPLPNVWMGVSIENDRHVYRADVLREIPAAVRFISAEPLLGPLPSLNLTGIDWIIVGGESGAGWRRMLPEWAQEIRDACLCDYCRPMGYRLKDTFGPDTCTTCEEEERPAFFFKQWGGRTPKANGRLLDGREWSEYPPHTYAEPAAVA